MRRLLEVLFISMILLVSCQSSRRDHPFLHLSYESLSEYRSDNNAVSPHRIRYYIDSLRIAAKDTDYIDLMTDAYYAHRRPYLWIDRAGINARPDTLLKWVEQIEKTGIPQQRFYLPIIRTELQRLRTLNFDEQHTASYTMASLEYYLTKCYLRYAKGQRFGFINPRKLFNHLERIEKDSADSPYRILYNIPIDGAGKNFMATALRCLDGNQLEEFLKEVQPRNPLYGTLCQAMERPGITYEQRKALVINIERTRWHIRHRASNRYIIVNLPAQQLTAYDTESKTNLSMKVCYGSVDHKTPMLMSRITHLELNPYWLIPMSIVRRDIVKHTGDTAYFSRHQFKIIERKTGLYVSPLHATSGMLLSGQYRVRQDKGEDNSLGRMIFRFPNPYSIYLHDTNDRTAFDRGIRAVSHGCIRLEQPFSLATFLLSDKDEAYIDRIRLSIDMPPETDEGKELLESHQFKKLSVCNFSSTIPLYIFYYTCFPLPGSDTLAYYPDIYGYDALMWPLLHNY